MIKRLFDILFSLLISFLLIFPLFFIAFTVKISSPGPVFYISCRIGINNQKFKMFKFRTMLVETPDIATHLLMEPHRYLTPIGEFLRKSSLDELPQLWNIFIGEMSFVGPRPALFNQNDLITLRTLCNVSTLRPGLTGWAQINGRDNLSIEDKVKYDFVYLKNSSLMFDLKIIYLTFFKVFRRIGVSH